MEHKLIFIALREILISLMGSTTPCTIHFAHSFSKEALDAHELTCPTVTHALVPTLYAALDPEFLTIQVRRGVFSRDLFQTMGEAMKVHCAPVRDGMVDDMVRTAMSGNVATGLRKCFDCVEVMKLVSQLQEYQLCGADNQIGHLQPPSPRSPPVPLEFSDPMRAVVLPLLTHPDRRLAREIPHAQMASIRFETSGCFYSPDRAKSPHQQSS